MHLRSLHHLLSLSYESIYLLAPIQDDNIKKLTIKERIFLAFGVSG